MYNLVTVAYVSQLVIYSQSLVALVEIIFEIGYGLFLDFSVLGCSLIFTETAPKRRLIRGGRVCPPDGAACRRRVAYVTVATRTATGEVYRCDSTVEPKMRVIGQRIDLPHDCDGFNIPFRFEFVVVIVRRRGET